MARRRHTQRRGQRGCRHVHDTGEMRVVVVEAVDRQPVQQHGIAQTQAQGKTDHRLIAATEGLQRRRRARREGKRRRRTRDPRRVDDQQLGPIDNCTRHILEAQPCREVGKHTRPRGCGRVGHGLRPSLAR